MAEGWYPPCLSGADLTGSCALGQAVYVQTLRRAGSACSVGGVSLAVLPINPFSSLEVLREWCGTLVRGPQDY